MLFEKNFIASAVGLRTVSYTFTSDDIPSGETFIPAGTIIKVSTTPKGVALDDIYFKGEETTAIGALIVAGHLYSDRMPVAPTTEVSAFAGQGLFFEQAPSTTVPADEAEGNE